MGSLFATNNTRRNSPAWCKEGMFTGIPTPLDARPLVLSAYAQWSGDFYGESFNVITTLDLRRTVAGDGWDGWSASSGKRILMQVRDTSDPALVDVTVRLFENGIEYEEQTWEDVLVTYNKPWGTILLRHDEPPESNPIEAQILG